MKGQRGGEGERDLQEEIRKIFGAVCHLKHLLRVGRAGKGKGGALPVEDKETAWRPVKLCQPASQSLKASVQQLETGKNVLGKRLGRRIATTGSRIVETKIRACSFLHPRPTFFYSCSGLKTTIFSGWELG